MTWMIKNKSESIQYIPLSSHRGFVYEYENNKDMDDSTVIATGQCRCLGAYESRRGAIGCESITLSISPFLLFIDPITSEVDDRNLDYFSCLTFYSKFSSVRL